MTPEVTVRAAQNEDAPAVIDLIARCFAEYPGCVLEVDLEEASLRHLTGRFDRFWVATTPCSRVVGTIALAESKGQRIELKKLYVDRHLRGHGIARTLIELVETEARQRNATLVELWTDTRFETAHRVYQKLGYRQTGAERALEDLSDTREFYFVKDPL